MNKALYVASFDPITNGHIWVIEQASKLFDEVIICVGENPKKEYTARNSERLDLVAAALGNKYSIMPMNNKYSFQIAKAWDCKYFVRGVRNNTDYEYESSMQIANSRLYPEMQTIFIPAPQHLVHVSSSFVKGLIGYDGWQDLIYQYVPQVVAEHLDKKYAT